MAETGNHFVTFKRTWTRTEIRPPEPYRTAADAYRNATDFNRWNQDRTWNCAVAEVVTAEEFNRRKAEGDDDRA